MTYFIHEKLDAYRLAVQFASHVQELLPRIRKASAELADQLNRASISVVLNIAEGAGEFASREKRRFYRIALRSGNECAATIDMLRILEAIDGASSERLRSPLASTVAMLTKLALH